MLDVCRGVKGPKMGCGGNEKMGLPACTASSGGAGVSSEPFSWVTRLQF